MIKRLSRSCHYINKVYAKERGIGKKPFLAVRTVMLEENDDLVADDFHGAARRRENSNNLSIIDPLLTALCRCLPAPHLCKDPDRFLAVGLTCVIFLNRLNPIDSGGYGFMVPSLFSRCLGLAPE